jgi:hypothetical protein
LQRDLPPDRSHADHGRRDSFQGLTGNKILLSDEAVCQRNTPFVWS